MIMRFLEDFAVGQTFGSSRIVVDTEQITRFAADFDPQPFYLDEMAARQTLFLGLAASGWHTAALKMRLRVDGDLFRAIRWSTLPLLLRRLHPELAEPLRSQTDQRACGAEPS